VLARVHLERIGWVTGSYAAVQLIRLATNVALARLLAPELFGIMLIVSTLRTGIELLSDLGIGQNIVSNKSAEEPPFYNTAWTLQVVRGLVLGLICVCLSGYIADVFEKPVLSNIFPVASIFFLLAGLESTCRFLLQRRLSLELLGKFEVLTALIGLVVHVTLAWITPTIWALMIGGLISAAAFTVGTHFLIPGIRHSFTWNVSYVWEIVHFGKWVFLASILYFLALNIDRLYLAKFISLAALGVYGIARSFSDMVTQLIAKLGNMIVFPTIAASDQVGKELRSRVENSRLKLVMTAAAGVAVFAAGSDLLVTTLYDRRYHEAALLLPVLSIGVWFAILSTIGESMLLGLAKPVYGAAANGFKLVTLIVGLGYTLPRFGLIGAVYSVALAEMARYLMVNVGQWREGLLFLRQDLTSTLCCAMLALLLVRLF
jgi:O-antigen/teichoic acid export membrane protein